MLKQSILKMKINQPGKSYELENFGDEQGTQTLEFTRKEAGYFIPGTTNEEIYDVLLDRLYTLQRKQPCLENSMQIEFLKNARSYSKKRVGRIQKLKSRKEDESSENNSE